MRSLGTASFLILTVTAVLLAGCGSSNDPPSGQVKTAHLYQTAPGAETTIRMGWTDNVPDPDAIVAWFVYRGQYYGFAADSPSLIAALDTQKLNLFEDAQFGGINLNFNKNFYYMQYGDQEQGSVDVTYNRASLVPGQTYYYRARRVVKPNKSAPPIASAQATTFTVDPSNALSQSSAPQGPVTYFIPPGLVEPSANAMTVNANYIIFRWNTSAGADEYEVRVYRNYDAEGTPLLRSGTIRTSSSVGTWVYDRRGMSTALQTGGTYYWVVGARSSGQVEPSSGNESGWIKSAVRQFRAVTGPPPIP